MFIGFCAKLIIQLDPVFIRTLKHTCQVGTRFIWEKKEEK